MLILLLLVTVVSGQSFERFDLAAGGKFLATGQFCSFDNATNAAGCQPTTWAQDANADTYFQDIGTGGQYYYYHDAAYAIRGGLCFQINGYNSSVLRATYGAAKAISFENGKTFHGLGGSTCGTPLAQYFRVNGHGRMIGWAFEQLSPLSIPNFGSFCFDASGQIDLNDFTGSFDGSIFNLPAACQSPNGPVPIPGGYCTAFYFQPGGQCNYKLYFNQP